MKKEGTFGVEQIIQMNIPKISFFFWYKFRITQDLPTEDTEWSTKTTTPTAGWPIVHLNGEHLGANDQQIKDEPSKSQPRAAGGGKFAEKNTTNVQ